MLTETVFRSEDVPAADRFECWRDLLRQLHAPLDLDSEHRSDFRAEQRVLELGEVSVWPTRFQPVRFLRTPKLIRQSDPEGVHLSLPLDGVLRATRGDRETAYGPDSLCLVDTSRPLDLRAGDSFSPRPHIGVGLEVPKALLPLTWDRIDRLTACRLSAREGFGGLLAQLLHQRLEHARRDLADPAQHATPIHAIAARWGFPRAADFTRAFRAAYGSPPRDYRHASSWGDTAGRSRP
ncbi:AraC family transcriptional regulator [Streptomyces tubercidicus]|uniref:AraC family transcriptional regulator n=1 Tax=Streptomyces tubercidicus TaxID=47759 RepID=UPI0034671552